MGNNRTKPIPALGNDESSRGLPERSRRGRTYASFDAGTSFRALVIAAFQYVVRTRSVSRFSALFPGRSPASGHADTKKEPDRSGSSESV
ncbi:hypothetical protein DB347_12590 [Opitutaceae bacterium EW11]|nr:hypothetical protein DB347_12590 [Opitutaceae bacterium EW11]